MKDDFFFQQRISSAGKEPLLPLDSLGVCNSSRSSDSTLGDKYLINEQTLPLTVVDEVTNSFPPEFPCQDSLLPLYITSLASTFATFLVLRRGRGKRNHCVNLKNLNVLLIDIGR